ncbi:glycosylphosphatidylinositol anchor biosynthesis [Coemansia sp. RSA 1721]|nr:glycosylphosphatidylinositol anchor biosynthesis [Coemansia sp. RSA 1721]
MSAAAVSSHSSSAYTAPKRPRRHMLFLALVVLRLVNVFLVQTFIHPDETWQSLEVAHRAVFGYGYITWEWRHALRGFAHPMLFAAVYRALAMLRLDDTSLILVAPYVVVALIAAAIDYATFAFAKRLAGSQVAYWAVFCSAVSWTMGSGIVRPLVNSAETMLTALAFVYWPWHHPSTAPPTYPANNNRESLPFSLCLAALSCIVRPTSAVLWLCAGIVLLINQPRHHRVSRTIRIITTTLLIGILALATMLLVDYLGYKQWVFPPYQFYIFNVQQDLGTWFGESPPLYHLYVSLPILFTSMLPFVIHGVYLSWCTKRVSVEPAVVAAMASFMFSLVGHMEYRFLYPLLPIGFMYCAISIQTLVGPLQHIHVAKKHDDPEPDPQSKSIWTVRNIVLYLLLTNIPATLYLNLVHQRGVVDVFKYLRHEVASNNVSQIGFLMPCHSTPFYSHLHKNIPMWFLSCEPPLDKQQLDTHYWEANDFEQSPELFLQKIFFTHNGQPQDTQEESAGGGRLLDGFMDNSAPAPGQKRSWPSHLVLYDAMVRRIDHVLVGQGYSECARFFNTHFNGDSRRKGDVVVYCKKTR